LEEEIAFYGHKNILSLHRKSLEITKDANLTLNGDCIIGVSANKACHQLDEKVKEKIRNDQTKIRIEIIVDEHIFCLDCRGNRNLLVSDQNDIVIRKSRFIDARTLAISSSKSAYDMPSSMIFLLRQEGKKALMRLQIE
jgi:uncharacterized protein